MSPRHSLTNTPCVVPPSSPESSSTARQPCAGQRTISILQRERSSTRKP